MEEKKCDKDCQCEKALHLAFGITKIVLKAAAVAAAFCLVKEAHKIHKAIEAHHEHHEHKKLL